MTEGQDFHLVSEPEFLDVEDAVAEHALHIAETGGKAGLRGEDGRRLLESALAQANTTYGGEFLHTSLFHMAAAYVFHLPRISPSSMGTSELGSLVDSYSCGSTASPSRPTTMSGW